MDKEEWRAKREAEEQERRRLAQERRALREAERRGRIALWRARQEERERERLASRGVVTQQAALSPVMVQAPQPLPPPPLPVQAAFVEGPPPEPDQPKPAVNNVFDLPKTLADSFEAFWKAYPRKVGKGDCKRIWGRLRPDEELCARMMRALERHKASDQWKREGGQYIPHPSTWLNQQRWEDGGEVQEVARKAESAPPPDEQDMAREALKKRQEILAKLKAARDGSQGNLFQG